MIPDPKYIPFSNIQQFFNDKESATAMVGGYALFWVDLQRTTPKEVFILTGYPTYTFASLGVRVNIGGGGTFVDDDGNEIIIYAYPYDANGDEQRYFIQVFNDIDVPQFVVEATPYVPSTIVPPEQAINGENELINPQFAQVFFNSGAPHTFTYTGASNEESLLAPGWSLIVSGTGTITVERIAMTEVNTPSNPPYVLDIQCSGVSTIILRQHLYQSPRLLARAYVSGYMIAASEDAVSHPIQMQYVPSGGSLDSNTIIDATVSADGSYNVLQGTLQITGTINPDPPTTGYVNIDIVIPQGSHLRLSSFQLVGTNVPIELFFDQQPVQLQLNQLFNVYMSSIQTQSKTSLTPWWFFPANPVQFGGNDASVSSQCSYIFDQTILYQTAANQVGVFIGPGEDNQVFVVKAVSDAADARFAIITYIAPQSVRGCWGYFLSCFARAALDTIHNTAITAKMRILYRTDLPPSLSSTEPIASWTLGQDPSFAAGWTDITPLNDPAYTLVAPNTDPSSGLDAYSGYAYNQFQLPVLNGDEDTLAVVYYIMEPLDSTPASEDAVLLRSIATVQNQFAIDWTPTSYSEVLQACQFYWETSYAVGVSEGTVTYENAYFFWVPCLAGDSNILAVELQAFSFSYQDKCIVPTLVMFAPSSGSANQVSVTAHGDSGGDVTATDSVAISGHWSSSIINTKCTSFQVTTSGSIVDIDVGAGVPANTRPRAYISYHWVANSVLGQ